LEALIMRGFGRLSAARTYFLACRPAFLTAGISPVLVGSALGYAAAGSFSWLLFFLALAAVAAIHAGANMANDYFDHLSGNDWVNVNVTAFSGGSRFIQAGLLSPRQVLGGSFVFLAAGAVLGAIIVVLTGSMFLLALGLAGLLGGFFYSAGPVRLGYRGAGEVVIGLLFGLFPVAGSYYLQAGRLDREVILPAGVVSLLIFLVILVNEFPDAAADRAASKRTLVVILGASACARLYRVVLAASFLLAVAMLFSGPAMFAGLFYLLFLPLGIVAFAWTGEAQLSVPCRDRASRVTVLLHAAGSLALSAGLLLAGLLGRGGCSVGN
jgi:1,4-dihydroxy-2-naphthoate octaprenyltransferase